jgi:hypothetical protein
LPARPRAPPKSEDTAETAVDAALLASAVAASMQRLQVALKKQQTLKPGGHFIGSRDESRRFQARGSTVFVQPHLEDALAVLVRGEERHLRCSGYKLNS